MNSFFSGRKRPRATVAGILGVALSCVLLLCGAGSVPVKNLLPQGTMQGDLDAGGHNVINAATISATVFEQNGANVFSPFGFDLYGLPQKGAIPPGSVLVVLSHSIETGAGGGTPPCQLMSGLSACHNVPVYNYAVSGTTAGPDSSTASSGLAILADLAPAYVEYVNGAQVATGNASVSSVCSSVTGAGVPFVYVSYGTNDVRGVNGMTLANFQTSIGSIYTTLHGYGAKVIGFSIPNQQDVTDTPPSPAVTVTDSFNNFLGTQSMTLNGGSGASYWDYYCDLASVLTNLTPGGPWSPDGLHPSAIGELLIAQMEADAILKPVVAPRLTNGTPPALPSKFSAYSDTVTLVGDGSWYPIELDTTADPLFTWDYTNGGYDASSTTFTAPVSGPYDFSAQVQPTSPSPGDFIQLGFFVNGTPRLSLIRTDIGSSVNCVCGSMQIYLNAGDTIQLQGNLTTSDASSRTVIVLFQLKPTQP